jgi:hypothetical protein
MKMIHVFKKRFFLGNEDIVDGAYVLSILWKSNSSRMRNDRDFKSIVNLGFGVGLLFGHEED